MTNDSGKSDKPIVPEKDANKARVKPCSAERQEGRGLAKGNSAEQTRFWTQGQVDLHHALDRIREVATRDRERYYPRQEPGAVISLAGICAGGGPKGPFLPRTEPKCAEARAIAWDPV